MATSWRDLEARWGELRERILLGDRLAIEDRLVALLPPRNLETVLPRLEGLLARAEASHRRWAERAARRPLVSYPEALPVSGRAAEIVELIRRHPVIVLAGETGSGKTTQLPKMCLDAGLGIAGKIACTQPRRVAALSVSQRIAEELGVKWGQEVGAKIRFTDQTSPHTLIKMLTDGMLLSEIQGDPLLTEYEAVILDEAHERSLNIDFLLGYLNLVRAHRPDLKILITSATIDTQAFSKAFGDAPIVEVSGRTYPVEVCYHPLDHRAEEDGELTYIEAAAREVEAIVADNRPGDILVFLPGEKDIHELRDQLQGRALGRAEILPLFGRLSNADQQRIFAPVQRRKIVLATNIAETSITIPGIRYVIDTGLARISRYSPQTHTQRLPIEPIAQSSANQRKGRAGRVADGVCIRLYEEQDFLARPLYATPEILRANLAAVILRMIAFNIGDVETFPFVDPPTPKAIQLGYRLLHDLGALDDAHRLTELGRELARLPCDPTVGRMLLQARTEGCLREVLVIAAALGIQDPRERPADALDAAEQQHRKFIHPESDFLTLLNIWNAHHDEAERMSQGQLRRFCKSHYLSYLRMREWRDVHQQLRQVMTELDGFRENATPAEYHQIHRAILAGLLTHIATREENNHYKATHNRAVMLFPGSALFDRKAAKGERAKHKGQLKPTGQGGGKTPPWILCAQWMETSRLFARTVARIDAAWILDLADHLCSRSHTEPNYDEKGERVVCRERIRLHGLEVALKTVGFSRVQPREAEEIFIRAALVDGRLRTRTPWFEHNQKLREKVEDLQTRLRTVSAFALDERVYQFYAQRLKGSGGSLAELNAFLREHHGGKSDFLRMAEADLLGEARLEGAEHFPERVQLPNGITVPIGYAYQPGQEADGATLRLPVTQLAAFDSGMLDWLVPGYVEERVHHLLRGLPKDTRVKLFPIADKAKELAAKLTPRPGPLEGQLTEWIHKLYGLRLDPREWKGEAVPEHLRPRVELVDNDNRVIAAGRDWKQVQDQYQTLVRSQKPVVRDDARAALWKAARAKHERTGLTAWDFPDQPAELIIGDLAGVPVPAHPALVHEGLAFALRLLTDPAQARRESRAAVRAWVEQILGRDLGWFQKDLEKELGRIKLTAATFAPWAEIQAQAWANFRAHVLGEAEVPPLRRATFDAAVAGARQRAQGHAQRLVDILVAVFQLRQQLILGKPRFPQQAALVAGLLHPRFLAETPFVQLQHLPRYLQAILKRGEKAAMDPKRDAEKEKLVAPFALALAQWKPSRPEKDTFRWLLEEYRVSLFAQELGTAEKVSAKRLEERLTQP